MNTTQCSPRENIAIKLIGVLDRKHPAKTGEEALKMLAESVRSDYGCMDIQLIAPRYRSIAEEVGIDPDEVWELVCSLRKPPRHESSTGQVVLKRFDTISHEGYLSTM